METDLVAKALRIMALEYMGLEDDSTFPPPKEVQDNWDKEKEPVICANIDVAHPDLKELRDLSTQIFKYVQANKRAMTIGQYEGIKRLATGIMELFWAGMALAYPKADNMKLVLVEGKPALVVGEASLRHSLMEAIVGGLQGHNCETM